MIIVKLQGGLGNQLFQYATGRSLSLRHEVNLKLDTSYFSQEGAGGTNRFYELEKYTICAEIATQQEISKIKGSESIISKIQNRLFVGNENVFKEKGFAFDANIFSAGSDIYLDGYWQSYKYFENIRDLLKKELTLRESAMGENKEYLEYIKTTEAVCVHVRRGDYVHNTKTNSFHGICDFSYYLTAIQHMKSQIQTPHFYIFSDDPSWCREHLIVGDDVTLLDHNDSDHAHEDLRLMTACKHFIISNSTFSWWAGWLSDYEDKIVIAPKRWFRDETIDTSDLIPDTWIRI